MKRSECTVEKLKELGYKACCVQESWFGNKVYECNARQTREVFEIVADTVRNCGRVEILRNEVRYTVTILAEVLNFEENRRMRYFLVRPMTEAERFESDIENGRGKDWDVVERK